MSNKEYDIHERIFSFVIAVVGFLNKLPKTSTNFIFIGQCIRAVTSMGANDQEADGALTKKDFIPDFIKLVPRKMLFTISLKVVNFYPH